MQQEPRLPSSDSPTPETFGNLKNRLASAQVAIYPIDARGLTMSTSTDSQETMLDIAHETGGRAYVNQNEI